jgi:hypothetical protein
MTWTVLFHDAFVLEFETLAEDLQDELLAHAKLLAEFGPHLGRPTVDTLKGSHHGHMKELRLTGATRFGEWLLHSTPSDKPSCWSRVTKVALISAGFINACLPLRTNAMAST